MTATEIARTLGGGFRSGQWWRCRCPVHGSRDATLALRNGERGLIVKCFAGCDPRDVLAELRRRGLIEGPCAPQHRAQPIPAGARTDNDNCRIAWARRMWDAARDARGTPVAAYLAGRGITIAPPPSLRWAPRCRHREAGAHLPAMVALVEHVERGVVGVHRTYLARDEGGVWRRRDRASLGPIAGGAVRLGPAGELLMVSEGIETGMSAQQSCMLPCWAALSTSGLVALALPLIVRTVIILADHDHNGAGERAARTAAQRWLAEDREVCLAMPPAPGTDFNDVLLGRTYACIEEMRGVAG